MHQIQIRKTKSGTKCQLSRAMGCGAARLVSSGRAINGRTKTPTPHPPFPFSHLLSRLSGTVCESVIRAKISPTPPLPYVPSICLSREKTQDN